MATKMQPSGTESIKAVTKRHTTIISEPLSNQTYLFDKENYKWMIIGLVVIVIGLLLMIGGKNQDPNTFDPKEVYSVRRITIAPILILLGLGLEIFAIFRRPDNEKRA